MNETYYLVDNNALVNLTVRRTRSEFFLSHCRLTADVLYEAREHPLRVQLSTLVVGGGSDVMARIRDVMATVDPGDTDLVDLYGNKGGADPGLVATAIVMRDQDEGSMFPDTWLVVTLDHAVHVKAREFGVGTMLPAELAALIDAEHGD